VSAAIKVRENNTWHKHISLFHASCSNYFLCSIAKSPINYSYRPSDLLPSVFWPCFQLQTVSSRVLEVNVCRQILRCPGAMLRQKRCLAGDGSPSLQACSSINTYTVMRAVLLGVSSWSALPGTQWWAMLKSTEHAWAASALHFNEGAPGLQRMPSNH